MTLVFTVEFNGLEGDIECECGNRGNLSFIGVSSPSCSNAPSPEEHDDPEVPELPLFALSCDKA